MGVFQILRSRGNSHIKLNVSGGNQLSGHAVIGRYAFDAFHAPDSLQILRGEVNQIAVPVGAADKDLSAHSGIELIADLSLGSLADGHNHNNRRNTDDNSKHGQNGTALVGPDIIHGHFYIFQ